MIGRAVVLLLVLVCSPLHADHFSAFLSGQSNACLLSPYLPAGSHVLLCQDSTNIRAWDPAEDRIGREFDAVVAAHTFDVFVWWQGESDGDGVMSFDEYLARLSTLYHAVGKPMMLVEITDPFRVRTHVKAVQAYAATSPQVALIPTADLVHDGDHLTPAGYQIVTQRLIDCYNTQCWTTQ